MQEFKPFKEAGVILSESSWEDPMWKTTDEYSRVGLYFKFNRFGYKKYEDVFGMPLERFMDYVKSHVILLFVSIKLISLSLKHSIIYYIIRRLHNVI